MKRISSVSELDKTFTIIKETIDSKTVYRLDGWLQIANESGVPITEINGEDAFDLLNKTGIRIGGNNTENSNQINNKAFFMSTSYLAYDPTKLYEFCLRFSNMSVGSTVECGFVGLTSRPTSMTINSLNEYMNECTNVLITAMSNTKTAITKANITSSQHFKSMSVIEEPASTATTIQENKFGFSTRKGYINAYTDTSNTYSDVTWVATAQDPTNVLSEILYVVPYFAVNLNSTSKTDGMEILIDSFEVNEGKIDEDISLAIPTYQGINFVNNATSELSLVARGQYFYAKHIDELGFSLCRAMTNLIPATMNLPNLAEDIIGMAIGNAPTHSEYWQQVLFIPNILTAVPVGSIYYIVGDIAPTGYLIPNGAAVSRTTYNRLFAKIGIKYGAGDGTTTFNLPNCMGYFVRCANTSSSTLPDYGRTVGSYQDYATAAPKTTSPSAISTTNGTISDLDLRTTNPSYIGFVRRAKYGEDVTCDDINSGWASNSPNGEIDVRNVCTGDAETRPVNIALLPIIKW